MLTQYQDAKGTPITVFFDGAGSRRGKPKNDGGGNGGSFIFARRADGG